MSRLEPPSPTLLDEPIDTDIPVLALEEVMSQEKSPVLSVVDLMAAQQRDPHALALRGLLTEHSPWNVDHNGTIGRTLPSGEFEVYVPDVIRSTEAVCFVTDSEPFARDGSDFKRGDEHGDDFRDSDELLSALAVETDMELTPIEIEEIMREQATDDLCRRLRNKTSARSLFDIDERGPTREFLF
jgi:hypothetical protein